MIRILSIIILLPLLGYEGFAGDQGFPDNTINRAFREAGKVWKDRELQFHPVSSSRDSEYYSVNDTIFILLDGSSELGYLVISSSMGRHDPFEYVLVYSMVPELLHLKILVYRSEYGSQVSSRAWLKQFLGIPPDGEFSYGSDINALSGATYSANSLTRDVNRLNNLINEIVQSGGTPGPR